MAQCGFFLIFLNMFPSSFPDLDHFNADSDPFFDVDQDSDLYHAFNPKINLSSYDNLSWHTGTRMRECLFEKWKKNCVFFYLKKMLVQYHYIFLCRHNVVLIAMRSNRRYANS